MKKSYIVLGAFFLLGIIFLLGRVGWHETHYTKVATVVKVVNGEEVTIKDADGYLWKFDKTGFKTSDIVEVTFWKNGTDLNILDDEIEVENIKVLDRK